MKNQKTIFITISKDIMRRNILDTKFWPKVQSDNPEAKFVLVVEDDKVDFFNERYGTPNVSAYGLQRFRKERMWNLAKFSVRTSLTSHSAKRYRMQAYELGEATLISTLIKTFIYNFLAPRLWYKKLVRWFLMKTMRASQIEKLFDEEKPDLVFAPSMIDNDFDIPVAAEAKRRGIRVIGMVRSWDNLTSHSLLGTKPDRMIHQNQFLKGVATGKYQEISEKDHGPMDVVGLPHYDLYKDPTKYIMPKEEYFREKGLDPNKKLIFVAGSQLYRSGYILPGVFDFLIENGKIDGPSQVLFRPHPKPMFPMEKYELEKTKNIILDTGSQSKVRFSDTANFINALYHSDVVIGVSSTITIDSAVFNKPCVDVNFDDPDAKIGYWASVNRLFDVEDHYERVVELRDNRIATSQNEMAKYVNEYFADPSLGEDGRKAILKEFVEPFDGKAGERLASIITGEIKGL
jgi:hypothetical protein